jgi:hypothetical protein
VHEERFTAWRPWAKRSDHQGVAWPGVYVIALSSNALAGRRFSWRKEVIYVGMTNAVTGLKGRLDQFDRTMAGKLAHGGADRVRFKHRRYATFSRRAYVAVAPFKCDPASNRPKDLRTMGDVARFEYVCFAHFVERFGKLPEFNDKERAPKFSRRTRRTR